MKKILSHELGCLCGAKQSLPAEMTPAGIVTAMCVWTDKHAACAEKWPLGSRVCSLSTIFETVPEKQANSAIEDKIIELQGLSCESCNRRGEKIAELRDGLKKAGCTHKYTEEYSWEHDNGYGRQKMLHGLRCKLCRKVQHWGSGTPWSST